MHPTMIPDPIAELHAYVQDHFHHTVPCQSAPIPVCTCEPFTRVHVDLYVIERRIVADIAVANAMGLTHRRDELDALHESYQRVHDLLAFAFGESALATCRICRALEGNAEAPDA